MIIAIVFCCEDITVILLQCMCGKKSIELFFTYTVKHTFSFCSIIPSGTIHSWKRYKHTYFFYLWTCVCIFIVTCIYVNVTSLLYLDTRIYLQRHFVICVRQCVCMIFYFRFSMYIYSHVNMYKNHSFH